jgi:hypothetical protein
MSDAANPDAPAPDPEPEPVTEDVPDTWTEDGAELQMVHGDAYNRTADAVVWVDARCVGCQNVSVCNVPADAADWTSKSTFADRCKVCKMLTPHNVISTLTGLNRNRDRGRVHRGDGGGG